MNSSCSSVKWLTFCAYYCIFFLHAIHINKYYIFCFLPTRLDRPIQHMHMHANLWWFSLSDTNTQISSFTATYEWIDYGYYKSNYHHSEVRWIRYTLTNQRCSCFNQFWSNLARKKNYLKLSTHEVLEHTQTHIAERLWPAVEGTIIIIIILILKSESIN